VSTKRKRLTGLPALLRADGFVAIPPYRKLRDMALDGIVPAEQHNGFWYFSETDVPAIARALELERVESPRRAA
jgi:hypothetical protein